MYYSDFPTEDQRLIDTLIGFMPWAEPGDPFGDDEFFFRTEDEVVAAITPWLNNPGHYGSMAHGLMDYFDRANHSDDPICYEDLGWGHVMKAGGRRYLFSSNAWSDSGIILNFKG